MDVDENKSRLPMDHNFDNGHDTFRIYGLES